MNKTSTWADVARNKGGTIAVPSSNVPRIGALELLIPGGKPDLLKIAQAVEKLCTDPGAWQPFMVGEKVYVQSLVPEKESIDDKKLMLEKGLIIGNTSVKVKETLGDTLNKDLMVGRIDGVTVTTFAIAELRKEFEKLGNIMHFSPRVFPGTRVKTGTIDFILDVTEKRHGPKRVYWLDNGTSRDPAIVSVQRRNRFCYFCRGTDHVRKNCTKAPECHHCHSRAHPPHLCERSSPQGSEVVQTATSAQEIPSELTQKEQRTEIRGSTTAVADPAASPNAEKDSITMTHDAHDLTAEEEQAEASTALLTAIGKANEEMDEEMTDVSSEDSVIRPGTPMLDTQSLDTQASTQVVNSDGSPIPATTNDTGKTPSKKQATDVPTAGESSPSKRPKRTNSISTNRQAPYNMRPVGGKLTPP